MYSIEGNNIYLTRGDTLFLQVSITRDGLPYTPKDGDSIRFAMKRRYKDSDDKVVVNKEIPISTLLLELQPEDTKNLIMGKTYVYDVQLTDAQGHVDTFIKGEIHIGNEVI